MVQSLEGGEMQSIQERLVRNEIERRGFVYTTQLAYLAELTKEGATAPEALKAIQQAISREVLEAAKPIKMGVWHIEPEAAFKWLEQYQPRTGGDHGVQDSDSERIQPARSEGDLGTPSSPELLQGS